MPSKGRKRAVSENCPKVRTIAFPVDLKGVPNIGRILVKSASPTDRTMSPTKETIKSGKAISAHLPKDFRFFVQMNPLRKKKGVKAKR